MNHFSKIAACLEGQGLDAVLLTEEATRFYASGFRSAGTDGIALVTRRGNYYFTDSRYTEAAERQVQDAQIREVGRGRGYAALLREVIAAAAKCLKFGGRFALCNRADRLAEVLYTMKGAGIEPKRVQLVRGRAGAKPYLLLCEGVKGGKPGTEILPDLVNTEQEGTTWSRL